MRHRSNDDIIDKLKQIASNNANQIIRKGCERIRTTKITHTYTRRKEKYARRNNVIGYSIFRVVSGRLYIAVLLELITRVRGIHLPRSRIYPLRRV